LPRPQVARPSRLEPRCLPLLLLWLLWLLPRTLLLLLFLSLDGGQDVACAEGSAPTCCC
jgi:hypothetical protein